MLDAPERTGARFSILLFLGFLLTPVVGFGAAVLFGILQVWQIKEILATGIVPAFSLSLVFFSLLLVAGPITWAAMATTATPAPTWIASLMAECASITASAPIRSADPAAL